MSSALARSASAQSPPECSLSKTNETCTLVIDRSNPVAPPTVQMYSDQQLTVKIKNPLPFERYFLDFTTGQAALTPDVTSSIVQGLFPSLQKLQFQAEQEKLQEVKAPVQGCESKDFTDSSWPKPTEVKAALPQVKICFGQLALTAITTYKALEPLVATDSLTSIASAREPDYYRSKYQYLLDQIVGYVHDESVVSAKVSAMSKAPANPKNLTPAPVYTPEDMVLITELADYQKITDAISADLLGYKQRIEDLGLCGYLPGADGPNTTCSWSANSKYVVSSQVVYEGVFYISKTTNTGKKAPDQNSEDWQPMAVGSDKPFRGEYSSQVKDYKPEDQVAYRRQDWICTSANCNGHAPPDKDSGWIQRLVAPEIVITSRQDTPYIYKSMVTRTITYSLDTLNLVSYSQEAVLNPTNKKALATIAINFADRPTKGPGIPYTALRWEASAGVFFSFLPNRTFTLSSTGTVQESKTLPTPVPFAAANYRLTGDFGGRWKQNFYLTAAVGINPNNTTAEFGAGPSYAWRGFMVNALCHFGHDVRPTTASLTSMSTTALPTTSHWTEKLAIGISIRVPSLTGR